MNARTSSQRHAESRSPARRGVDAGECIVSDMAPFCWRGCDGHFWQHQPTQWFPVDDDDYESPSSSTEPNGSTE